jgi:ParB/RepB/Spo0J family partition protein
MKTTTLPVASLRRHPDNARTKSDYSNGEIADLVASIKEHGLLQPLVVAANGDGHQILAGHRRHAALKALGVETVPCIVVTADEQGSLGVLITENATHKAVDPLREAAAVAKVVEGVADEKRPYERAAAILGKSVGWVRDRMRLTALSPAWRKAREDAESPIREWPVGHLELVAALPEPVQNEILEEWTTFESSGVPLLADLKASLARSTCDLGKVPWDRDAVGIVDGAPACSACPFRASVQGVLFADDSRGDRCLNAPCFEAKRRATVAAQIVAAREKYGETLRVEVTFGLEDVPVPDGVKVHREFDLVPRSKAKGGFPVLRLRSDTVSYMGEAQEAKSARDSGRPTKRAGPKSMAMKRTELAKRRQVRAIEVFRGSLLARAVVVGPEKHPKKITPPEPKTPDLPDLVALVLAYGTGSAISAEAHESPETLSETLTRVRAKGEKPAAETRQALWDRVREPIARSLRILGPMRPEQVDELAKQASAVGALCGLDWEREFVAPATVAIPEPRAWSNSKKRRAG